MLPCGFARFSPVLQAFLRGEHLFDRVGMGGGIENGEVKKHRGVCIGLRFVGFWKSAVIYSISLCLLPFSVQLLCLNASSRTSDSVVLLFRFVVSLCFQHLRSSFLRLHHVFFCCKTKKLSNFVALK